MCHVSKIVSILLSKLSDYFLVLTVCMNKTVHVTELVSSMRMRLLSSLCPLHPLTLYISQFVAIGPTTAEALSKAGAPPSAVSSKPSPKALVEAIS